MLTTTQNYEREHLYHDENGQVIARKLIYKSADGSKSAEWQHLDNGKWLTRLTSEIKNKIPLYHIHKLIQAEEKAMNGFPLFFVEGEKDAETLETMNIITTTTRNGGGCFPKWEDINRYISCFDFVYVLCDNDETGEKYAVSALKTLQNANVYIIDTLDVWNAIPRETRVESHHSELESHADITDLVERYGLKTAHTALMEVCNKRNRFGNSEKYEKILAELKKKKQNTKKPKSDQKKEKDYEIQNKIYDTVMDVLKQKPFIWRLSSPWLYENGTYSEFNVKKYIKSLHLTEKIKRGTMDDIALNLQIHSHGLEVLPYETLVCLNDVVYDFITGVTEPHNKRYLFTYKFDYLGNPDAVQTFLEAFCDVPDKLGYFLGSCFFSHSKLEKCLFIIGDIGTGKSSLAKALSNLFPENTTYLDLAKKYFDRFDLFGLADSWLNVMDDVYINENNFRKIQSIISGVPFTTERKYGDPVKIQPRTKLLFTTNSDPIFSHDCEGMKRRSWFLHTRHCDNLPPEPTVNDWLAYGLMFAKRLYEVNYKVNYADEVIIHNPIKEFLDICEFPIPASEFYTSFIVWMKEEHGRLDRKITSDVFYNQAKKLGYESKVIWQDGKSIRLWVKLSE
jgi:putative DNA primase/helicase